MKKIFLSTMMFASMQLLSASENNYQNLQTTRTDFDDNEYQAQKKFNDNNNDYEDVVEDTRLLTDDYINEMDLNKHISISIYENDVYHPLYEKYGQKPNKNNLFFMLESKEYKQFVKSYEYKIEEFLTMMLYYDSRDNSMIINFCHPGEESEIDIDLPHTFQNDKLYGIIAQNPEQFEIFKDLVDEICKGECERIEISPYTIGSGEGSINGFQSVIQFSDDCSQCSAYSEADNTTAYKLFKNNKRTSKLPFYNIDCARLFIDFLFQYADLSEKEMIETHHYNQEFKGEVRNHCKNVFLECEKFKDLYQIDDDLTVSCEYENNIINFSLDSEFNLDLDLFNKASEETGYPIENVDFDEDELLPYLSEGRYDRILIDLSYNRIYGASNVDDLSDPIYHGDYENNFHLTYYARKFIRAFIKTLELMEQKYFDSKKLENSNNN